MSALLLSALAAGSSGQGALYVDDVFSTYLYTGNGSTQTINNGIDLAGKGGLVWVKDRTSAVSNALHDTARGFPNQLVSNTTAANAASTSGVTGVSASGFSVGPHSSTNAASSTYASWTFRKAPKFFDVQPISHTNGTPTNISLTDLGTVGMVVAKITNTTGDWIVWHRSLTAGNNLRLNTTAAQTTTDAWLSVSGTTATLSASAPTGTYVIYAWAHDPSADGIIQCGSYTGSAAAFNVSLGWEPQYILAKCATDQTTNWLVIDSMRGLIVSGLDSCLAPNLSSAESGFAGGTYLVPTATGFSVPTGASLEINQNSKTFVYLAIRRPNKPPTSGEQVFAPIASSAAAGTKLTTSFPVDMQMTTMRPQDFNGFNFSVHDSLRGVSTNATQNVRALITSSTSNENASTAPQTWAFDNTGFKFPNYYTGYPALFLSFRRAPEFFDVVCDTGTGVAHAITHNLTKAPELIIRKSRSAATQWEVWHSALAATEKLMLNSNAAKATDATAWGSTLPTATQFTVGTGVNVNANAATFVTYLFATLAGISKVGSYTGNGSSQTIDCGFSTGARFFLVKATSTTGSWWVYDSARGIVSAADPALQLNSTAAEITSADAVDPASVGIIVNQEATCSINATGVSYIFLAIA